MFRFNLIGFVMVAISAGCGFLIAWLVSANVVVPFQMIAGIFMIPIDAYYRWKNPSPEERFLHKCFSIKEGGWFALPVWTLGIGFILIGLFPDGPAL
ncbi:MAG: hypothetical protein AAGD96_12640 [Chloroflexota bacterium]